MMIRESQPDKQGSGGCPDRWARRSRAGHSPVASLPVGGATPRAYTRPMSDTTGTPSDLLVSARAMLPELVAYRRRLHRHPEVGLDLPWTQAAVADELRRLGLEPRLGSKVSSVSAVIEGALPGPTILLRADMDALPLTEDTGLDFASEIPDRMHACGHDTHVTMLMGGVRLLLERRAELRGRVLLMFQPGEEGWFGAPAMLDEGLLASVAPEATGAFAIHISTHEARGGIWGRPGPMMAAADTLNIVIRGRGGHASMPHRALDPVPVAAEVILALQSMVTRSVDIFDPAVVTIAHIEAGFRDNIVPETVHLEGTLRTLSETNRSDMHARIRRVVEGVCAAHGATAEVVIDGGYPVTVNDPDFAPWALGIARSLLGDSAVILAKDPLMGAEDFSYVLQQVPGAMFFLGARPAAEDPETAPMNHSNRVVYDENAMASGAALYAAVALAHADRAG
jgi:amidohydrolase